MQNESRERSSRMKFAVQLYNFREELATDFKGTQKHIADMGFDGV